MCGCGFGPGGNVFDPRHCCGAFATENGFCFFCVGCRFAGGAAFDSGYSLRRLLAGKQAFSANTPGSGRPTAPPPRDVLGVFLVELGLVKSAPIR